ncbi:MULTISPECIES: MATE family efflux transporter [Pseudomonas]|uniref:Multidrug-efflux transporter n=1 Tax=Pseudomonas fluorescens (strain Q2-87) TaxID=1038922 RepID=J2MVK5_PSEFQ|nr:MULTISPECIES: MATE family efflux transporter [Pseudomonas]EJL05192.1 MATE efflux family protein [Pseudomonas fluorescens Q2-87]
MTSSLIYNRAVRLSRRYTSEMRESFRLSLAFVFGNIAHVIIATTDVIMAGWISTEALAASTLAQGLYYLLFLLFSGLLVSTIPFITDALGSKEKEEQYISVSTSCVQLIAAAFLICLSILYFTKEILVFFGQDILLSLEAQRYMSSLMWSIGPAILFVHLRNVLSIMGSARYAVIAIIIASVFNFVAHLILIFGFLWIPPLGLFGAGIATTLTNVLLCMLLITFGLMNPQFRERRHCIKLMVVRWRLMLPILKNGIPVSLTQANDTLFFFILTIVVGKFGVVALAAHGIAMQVLQVVFTIPNGISQASTTRISLCSPLGLYSRRTSDTGWSALWLSWIVLTVTSSILIIFSNDIVQLFVARDDGVNDELIMLSSLFVSILGIFHFFDGSQMVLLGIFRGLKKTVIPMLLSIICFWLVGLPLALLLAFYTDLGAAGIWCGLALGLLALFSLLLFRWIQYEPSAQVAT